jgi:hypothetical protein
MATGQDLKPELLRGLSVEPSQIISLGSKMVSLKMSQTIYFYLANFDTSLTYIFLFSNFI